MSELQNRYVITYWWQKPTPKVDGEERPDAMQGIAGVEAPLPWEAAIEQFRRDLGDENDEAEFTVLSVVRPYGMTALLVDAASIYVSGTWVNQEDWGDMVDSDIEAAAKYLGTKTAGNLYVVTGEVGEDNIRFVQVLRAAHIDGAVDGVLIWLNDQQNLDGDDVRVWSVVERLMPGARTGSPGEVKVYGSTLPSRYGYTWTQGDYAEVAAWEPQTVPATGAAVAAALQAINTHRARIGQPKLDPGSAGWTDQDVLDEALRIGTIRNPGRSRRERIREALRA